MCVLVASNFLVDMQVGPTADSFVARGVTITTVRKLAQGLAFLGPALCMVACALLTPEGTSATIGEVICQMLGLRTAVCFRARTQQGIALSCRMLLIGMACVLSHTSSCCIS